jgi:hypothetical protein
MTEEQGTQVLSDLQSIQSLYLTELYSNLYDLNTVHVPAMIEVGSVIAGLLCALLFVLGMDRLLPR